jgi:hypothetical protein
MLYIPFLVGVILAGDFPLRAALLLFAITCVFISRPSLHAWWRACKDGRCRSQSARPFLVLLALGALAAAPLVLLNHLYVLFPLGAVAAILLIVNADQASRREDRTLGNEIVGILGLTLTAPAAYYVVRQQWDWQTLWLWGMCSTFFASSVFYVRLRVYSTNPRKQQETLRLWKLSGLYHSCLLLSLLLLTVTGNLHAFALIAFAPAIGRTFWFMFRPGRRLNLKRIGILEVVYSVIFFVFTALN